MAKQVTPEDDDTEEEWTRELPDPEHDTRGVTARKGRGYWIVLVEVMSFIRGVPLEDELRANILAALQSAAGVTEAGEEDREIWFVRGAPNGGAMVDAVGAVLDELADKSRAQMALDRGE